MSYRNDLDALAAREAALALEVEDKIRERDTAARMLEEARARDRLPILDNIRVATPCSADWNAMTGDERARLCAQCDRHVYNISGLTRDEAEELIIEKEGELCVRYFQRADGTILLADCEVGKKQKRRRRLFVVGAATTLAVGGASAYAFAFSCRAPLERVKPTAVVEPGEVTVAPMPPPPAPLVHEPARVFAGVPPTPTAEERLRYKQLKAQSKTKRRPKL